MQADLRRHTDTNATMYSYRPTRTHAHTRAHIHTNRHTYKHTYKHTYIHLHTHTYTYIHIHTQAHTNTHTLQRHCCRPMFEQSVRRPWWTDSSRNSSNGFTFLAFKADQIPLHHNGHSTHCLTAWNCLHALYCRLNLESTEKLDEA